MSNSSPAYEVLRYLRDHAGVPFHVSEIANDTEMDVQAVNNACAHLAREDKGRAVLVCRVRRGTYMFQAPRSADDIAYENRHANDLPDGSKFDTSTVKAGSGQTWATVRTKQGDYITGVVQATWEAWAK